MRKIIFVIATLIALLVTSFLLLNLNYQSIAKAKSLDSILSKSFASSYEEVIDICKNENFKWSERRNDKHVNGSYRREVLIAIENANSRENDLLEITKRFSQLKTKFSNQEKKVAIQSALDKKIEILSGSEIYSIVFKYSIE